MELRSIGGEEAEKYPRIDFHGELDGTQTGQPAGTTGPAWPRRLLSAAGAGKGRSREFPLQARAG